MLFDACTLVSAEDSASLSFPCSLQVSQPPPHQLPLASLLVLLLHLHLELCFFQLILSVFLGHKSLFVNRYSITTYLLPTAPPNVVKQFPIPQFYNDLLYDHTPLICSFSWNGLRNSYSSLKTLCHMQTYGGFHSYPANFIFAHPLLQSFC